VGTRVRKFEFVQRGQSALVNGKAFAGPLYVMRETVLGEISFVDMGADGGTAVSVAATAPQREAREEPENMNPFETWLKAMGLDPATLADDQKAKLQAKFDAEQKATPAAPPAAPAAAPAVPATPPPVLQFREAEAAESRRIGAIRKACAGHAEIEARAIAEGWPVEKAELEVVRADRPKAPAARQPATPENFGAVLQAAAMLSGGIQAEALVPALTAPVVEAAQARFRHQIGLQELLVEAALANGFTGRQFRGHEREVLRYAFTPNLMAAGFSAIDVSGIMSATANKFLLAGFNAIEDVWRSIAAIRSVKDFKQVTSYRLTGTEIYQEIGPAGEFKHGSLGEESYTNQAATYGLMMALTRQDIINDDLGALTAVPRKLGRGAALKLNDVFWTIFLDAGNTFWTAGHGNYQTGAGTALGIDGMTAVETAFLGMTDADGNPIGVSPAILLVPPALSVTAQQLYKGTEIRDAGASSKYLVTNPHAGKYRVTVSRYLSMAAYTNYSTLAWYLLADPNDVPVIEVAFLNGQQSPTVETADADFTTLGIQMRGYHDFGVALQDYRGGQKAKGGA